MKNRLNKILEILTDKESADVVTLSKTLEVSQVTIRKDLDKLEEIGVIKRQHGFAVLSASNDILARLAYHFDEKRLIAKEAAKLVKDGETIMIESGSCCALLAEELSLTKKNLTLITNSAFISDYIRKNTSFEIVLLGGNYQKDSQAIVGPMVALCAKNFWVNKFFIGIDGYSYETGFTNKDQARAQAVRDMANQSDQVIILTESAKFLKHGTVPMNITKKVSTIITDTNIKKACLDELAKQDIKVIRTSSKKV